MIISKSNPPVIKKCKRCKHTKLLSEFDFSDEIKSKRVATCKSCMEESENGFGTCCMDHFNKMMITSTFNQFQIHTLTPVKVCA